MELMNDKNIKHTRIALDLDGLLLQFSKAAYKKLDLEYPTNTILNDNLYELAGDKRKFWSTVKGHEFWASLEKYPWSDDLIQLVDKYAADWIFLTKAAHDPFCYSGKFECVQRYWPKYINRLWIVNGTKARFCRGVNDVLIDDKEQNLREWGAQGGSTFHWREVTDDYNLEEIWVRLKMIEDLISRNHDL